MALALSDGLYKMTNDKTSGYDFVVNNRLKGGKGIPIDLAQELSGWQFEPCVILTKAEHDALQRKLTFQNGELVEKQKYILYLERVKRVPDTSSRAQPATPAMTIPAEVKDTIDGALYALRATSGRWISGNQTERIDAALAWLEAQKEATGGGNQR